MSAYTKRMRNRLWVKGAKHQRRGRSGAAATVPPAAEEIERPFDEPATAPRKPNVSVEEPVAQEPVAQEEEACGSPNAGRTPASDLH